MGTDQRVSGGSSCHSTGASSSPYSLDGRAGSGLVTERERRSAAETDTDDKVLPWNQSACRFPGARVDATDAPRRGIDLGAAKCRRSHDSRILPIVRNPPTCSPVWKFHVTLEHWCSIRGHGRT